MSRNSSRTVVHENAPGEAAPVQPQLHQSPPPNIPTQNNTNPLGMSFVVPTEFVELPSKGRYYDPQSPLYGQESIEIRHMTAKEEDILANQDYVMRGVVLDKLIDSIIVTPGVTSLDLLSGDKNAILVAARSTGYGKEYSLNQICPHCEEIGEFKFDLEKVRCTDIELEEGVEYVPSRGVFTVFLPKSEITVGIRLLIGRDEEYFEKQKKQQSQIGIETNTTIEFLRKVIVDANGFTDRSLINNLIEVLPALDSRKVRAVYKRVMPELNTAQEVVCPNCSQESESEVPFTLGFFWPDV